MIKRNISFIFCAICALFIASCEQDNTAYCSCLKQAEKVNKLSSIIWSGSATKKDSIALKNALLKKDQLCQPIQQSKDNAIQELRGTCQ
jgi:hypothetical protein